MKFGQALSVFEAALPEEIAGPYRQALTKLQEAAPPLPVASVHKVLAEQLGPDWRDLFVEFDDSPGRRGQHRPGAPGAWREPGSTNGRTEAVTSRSRSSIRAPATRCSPTSSSCPGWPACSGSSSPAWTSSRCWPSCATRITEELDYELEAESQRAFAAAYADDPEIFVPAGGRRRAPGAGHRVGRRAPRWPRSSASGTEEERDEAGRLMATLHFSAPPRAGLLHADPHPGNFRLLPDGRLGVIDFGAVARMPGGHPGADRPARRAGPARRRRRGRGGAARRRASSGPTDEIDAEAVLDFIRPMLEPIAADEFRFTRAWLRGRGGPAGQPALPGVPAEPAAQPAAVVPADPPGDARLDRGALPAGGEGALPRASWSAGCPASPRSPDRRAPGG